MIEIRTPTKEEVDFITFDEEIWGRTTDDYCPQKEICKIPYDKFEFFGGYVDGKIIGLASIEKKDNRFHFEVLKPYRLKFAREFLKEFLKKIDKQIYCAIPIYHRSVINFAKNNGFIEEGILQERFIKNGVNYHRIKLKHVKNS